MKKLLIGISVLMLTSCQAVTRKIGGTTEIKVEKGYKVIEATWKDDGDLWYLIEPMEDDYIPKEKKFVESSIYGVLEGKVIFIESK